MGRGPRNPGCTCCEGCNQMQWGFSGLVERHDDYTEDFDVISGTVIQEDESLIRITTANAVLIANGPDVAKQQLTFHAGIVSNTRVFLAWEDVDNCIVVEYIYEDFNVMFRVYERVDGAETLVSDKIDVEVPPVGFTHFNLCWDPDTQIVSVVGFGERLGTYQVQIDHAFTGTKVGIGTGDTLTADLYVTYFTYGTIDETLQMPPSINDPPDEFDDPGECLLCDGCLVNQEGPYEALTGDLDDFPANSLDAVRVISVAQDTLDENAMFVQAKVIFLNVSGKCRINMMDDGTDNYFVEIERGTELADGRVRCGYIEGGAETLFDEQEIVEVNGEYPKSNPNARFFYWGLDFEIIMCFTNGEFRVRVKDAYNKYYYWSKPAPTLSGKKIGFERFAGGAVQPNIPPLQQMFIDQSIHTEYLIASRVHPNHDGCQLCCTPSQSITACDDEGTAGVIRVFINSTSHPEVNGIHWLRRGSDEPFNDFGSGWQGFTYADYSKPPDTIQAVPLWLGTREHPDIDPDEFKLVLYVFDPADPFVFNYTFKFENSEPPSQCRLWNGTVLQGVGNTIGTATITTWDQCPPIEDDGQPTWFDVFRGIWNWFGG